LLFADFAFATLLCKGVVAKPLHRGKLIPHHPALAKTATADKY
jgi:hypothetical protein